MNFIQRAMLYISRKKGRTVSLFLVVFVVAVFLISCFGVLNASERLSRDIRTSLGAAFYIRANTEVSMNENGGTEVKENDIHISQKEIDEIIQAGEIKYSNPINYGFAKSDGIQFIPGDKHTKENNMGKVTALNFSALAPDFTDETVVLIEGKHITEADKGKILISEQLASANHLSVSDTLTLTHAKLGEADGAYIDEIPVKTAFVQVTVSGIYHLNIEDTSIKPTAGIADNEIYASLDVLDGLHESEAGIYTGEVDFYVTDPVKLESIIRNIQLLQSIDWTTHFIRTNDLGYSKIEGQLSSLGDLVKILLILVSVVSTAFLTLLLTMRMRGRMQEAGILLAAADVQTAIGGKIMLDLDTDGHMGSGQQNGWGTVYGYNGDLITQEIVDAIGKIDGVVGYNSEDTAGYYGAGVNFKYLPAAFGLSYTQYGEASSYTATLSSEKCSKFQSGKYKLVDGRHITPDDKHACLISKELADYNKLSAHDKIKMYSLDSDAISEFEIVGIFDGTEGTSGNPLTVDEIPANCGYIDYATMFELFKEELNGYQQLTIYVEDPVSVQNVYDKISALPELKGKTMKLSIDTDEYDVVSKPLESLPKLVNTTIIIISVVSVVILTLFLTVWIRGRKKEIGILLSIGKSKANIILQIFTETFVVAVISFASSIPLSNLIAEKTGAFLVSRVTMGTANLNVQINTAYMLPLYLIGILLIAIAVAASSWSVVRWQPRDILMKYE